MIRLISNLVIAFSVFIFPPYFTFILILLGIFFINDYSEAVLAAFFIDTLYNGGTIFGVHFALFFTVVTTLLYLLSFKLKSMLRMSY